MPTIKETQLPSQCQPTKQTKRERKGLQGKQTWKTLTGPMNNFQICFSLRLTTFEMKENITVIEVEPF